MADKTIIITKADGKWSTDKDFEAVCSTLRNGTYTVTIKRKVEQRSINQNALMWMWFTCIEVETGTPKVDVHDYYCNKYLARTATIGERTYTITGSTKELNTVQFTRFLQQVQADAATELGITLPLPEDRYYIEFINEYGYK